MQQAPVPGYGLPSTNWVGPIHRKTNENICPTANFARGDNEMETHGIERKYENLTENQLNVLFIYFFKRSHFR